MSGAGRRDIEAIADELRPALRSGIADLSVKLKGEPNRSLSSKTEFRWGRKGSFRVIVSGAKQGACVDFEGGWKGDPIALIMLERGCDFVGVVLWGAAWTGIDTSGHKQAEPDPAIAAAREEENQRRQAEQGAEAALDIAKRVQTALWWWGKRKPLAGTPGAVYLASRGLHEPDGGWPDCMGWMPDISVTLPSGIRLPCAGAVIFAATDDSGDFRAIQRVYVDRDNKNVRDDAGMKVKLSRGDLSSETGGVVRLPGDPTGPLQLGEGPESSLSMWTTGHETWIALGGLGGHRPPLGRVCIACIDDDKPQSPADKAVSRALAVWRNAGADVRVASPWAVRRHDKSDFNDLLQVGGVDAVRERIERAINPQPPGGAPKRVPVTDARDSLSIVVAQFAAKWHAWDAAKAAALEQARVSISAEMWSVAPDDVRTFHNTHDAVKLNRDETQDNSRSARKAKAGALGALRDVRRTEAAMMARAHLAQQLRREAADKVPPLRAAMKAAVGKQERVATRAEWKQQRNAALEADQEYKLASDAARAARRAAAAAHDWSKEASEAARVEAIEAKAAAADARAEYSKVGGKAADVEARRLKVEVDRIEADIELQAQNRAAQEAGAAPVHGIKIDVAGGKTEAALRLIAAELIAMRKAGDNRTVFYAGPTVDGLEEIAERFRKLNTVGAAGLTAQVWRGRKRPDPNHPDFNDPKIPTDSKTKMCRDPDALNDAEDALADIDSSICQQRDPDGKITHQCQFFDLCGTQRQKNKRADVWFGAHELVDGHVPAAWGKVAFRVVDETAWPDWLEGVNGHPIDLPLDTIAHRDTIPDDPAGTERLQFLRARVVDAIAPIADQDWPFPFDAFSEIDASSAADGRRLEWRRKLDAKIYPGQPAHLRKQEAAIVSHHNKKIAKLSRFWTALEYLKRNGKPGDASGWARLTDQETKEGLIRVVRLKGRKRIPGNIPTMILDATFQQEPISYFFPTLKVVADITIEAPFQSNFQVCDRSYSKAHLNYMSASKRKAQAAKTAGEPSEVGNNFRDLRATIFRIARHYAPKRVALIIQLDFEDALKEMGALPGNLVIGHHNAMEGVDTMKDVAALIQVGRTAPSPQSVEIQAEALTGWAVRRTVDAWYPKGDAYREMMDGSFRVTQTDCHAIAIVEACRWRVAEGTVIQNIGRARGINRGTGNPVDVWILTDVPLPMPVTPLSAADLDPSPADLMLSEGGAAFRNSVDAATVYPQLWNTPSASKLAFHRWAERWVTNSNKSSLYEFVTHLGRVDYQLAGPGKKPTSVDVIREAIPDPQVWLTDRLGGLAWCRLAEAVAAPEQPAAEPIAPVLMFGLSQHHFEQTVAPRGAEQMRAAAEPTAPEMPDGYGIRPAAFPGMKPIDIAPIGDVLAHRPSGRLAFLMWNEMVNTPAQPQPAARPAMQPIRAAFEQVPGTSGWAMQPWLAAAVQAALAARGMGGLGAA